MASPALILAIESSTRVARAAVLRGAALLAEFAAEPTGSQSEQLLPAVDRALREAGVRVAALDAFAVSIGPGSFTGLRVGIATARGLAFGSGRPVAAVSTLAALASGVPSAGAVASLLDARRGELYAAVFETGPEGPVAIVPEGVYTPEDFAARLPTRCTLAGEGVALFSGAAGARLGPGVRIAAHGPPGPRAVDVGRLGARILARGEGIEASRLVPRYLRRAEAEVKRTGQRFEAAAPAAGPRMRL